MATVRSVNVGRPRAIKAKSGLTGVDKVPTTAPVAIAGPSGKGEGALVGDAICDATHHGGDAQAVYAYAREDLDSWQVELGRTLRSGMFGENLTTADLEVTEARTGETWRVGTDVVLQVSAPRIPCVTFAVWMAEPDWLRRFTRRARPGAYLRMLAEGEVRMDDPIVVNSRPDHRVTVGLVFRALTLEPELVPALLDASDDLEDETVRRATDREPFVPADDAGR